MSPFSPGNPFIATGGLPRPPDKKRRINVADKGKRAERHLAKWWQAHGFPDAARHVKTGDQFTPDEGDLVLEHEDFRLVIEVKHHDGGLTDGQITEFGSKLIRQVKQSKGTMGILVERRDRLSDAGRWWVHLDPYVFARLCVGYPDFVADPPTQWAALACRTDVNYFAQLLTEAGLSGPWNAAL